MNFKPLKQLISRALRNKRLRDYVTRELFKNYPDGVLAGMASATSPELLKRLVSMPEFFQQGNMLFHVWAETLQQRETTIEELTLLEHAAKAGFYYSQEGEDVLLFRFLGDQKDGFFVDVGAHHPTRFSNTYALYRKGWQGINIDATPGSMEAFRKLRPRDINLEAAISNKTAPMAFHMFAEPALNTFDANLAESYIQSGWKLTGIKNIVPKSLSMLLEAHMPPTTSIDLMSIDVEGEELGVLKSNNWEKYAPQWLINESLDRSLADVAADDAVIFLKNFGYTPISKLKQSIILHREF